MKNLFVAIGFILVLGFGVMISAACAQDARTGATAQKKSVDVNKDGVAEVTYYHDGKNVTRTEADTNYDGKLDVVVYSENGKFKSAEADTDYNGTMETKFTDPKVFKEWVNKEKPAVSGPLGLEEWTCPVINKF